MRDVYLMNKETGELVPSQKAIDDFYRTHHFLDDWQDEWQETELEVSGSFVTCDFASCINF